METVEFNFWVFACYALIMYAAVFGFYKLRQLDPETRDDEKGSDKKYVIYITVLLCMGFAGLWWINNVIASGQF